MRIAIATLESVSPYSQGRYVQEPKLEKELADDYEKRTWRHRMHADENGEVFIPPMAFKNCLSEIAKFLAEKIPGKGKATWTKHFEAGVLVVDPVPLGIKRDEVVGEWLHVPSDGRRGGSTRVLRCFPRIDKWSGDVIFHVVDDTITPDVFQHHLEQAGKFIGLGRFRPRNNGYYGRFSVKEIVWQ